MAQTKIRKEQIDDNAGGSLANTNISPAGADQTAAVNTRYFADLSGLTAERNFILPAGTVGDTVELVITVGDDDYEYVVKGDTGITICGGVAATEWSRLFIGCESITLIADTTSNWEVVVDGRIPSVTKIHRAVAQTVETDTSTLLEHDTVEIDNGNLADIANSVIIPRRSGVYDCKAGLTFVLGDQDRITLWIRRNTTSEARFDSYVSNSGDITIAVETSTRIELSAGDEIDSLGRHSYGDDRDTLTENFRRPRLSLIEVFT